MSTVADVVAPMLPQAPHRLDQMNRPMPRPERTGKDDECSGRRALERNIAGSVGREPRGVGAPFDLDDPLGCHPGREDIGLRREKEVGVAALPVAPAPHRLQQASARSSRRLAEPGWSMTGALTSSTASAPTARAATTPLTAEVVVPLDHHVGPDSLGQRPDPRGQQPAQATRAQRRL